MSQISQNDRVTDDSLLGQIIDEFLDRRKRGEAADIDEYAERYPELAEVLRQVLPTLQLLQLSAAGSGEGPITSDASFASAEPLGDFRLLRELGRGGMGVVYEAEQMSLDRHVALKVLPFAATMDPRHLQRFRNEARAAASLEHPHIVDVYGVGVERGVHYYAMRLIEGHTLAEVVGQLRLLQQQAMTLPKSLSAAFVGVPGEEANQISLSISDELITADQPDANQDATPRETKPQIQADIATKKSSFSPAYFRSVAELGKHVAEALDCAHEHGIIHRDIKPSNLMLDEHGKVWVTDFGLAQVETGDNLTMTGDLIGTLRYMSPEQALAKRAVVDHRCDVYSLGVTLYEVLTLQPAFPGDDRQEILRQIAFEEPVKPRLLNKAIPAELETIVLKAMEKNPAERYATAQELADDLQRFVEDKPIQAKRPTLVQRTRKWARRHQPLVWSAVIVSLLALFFGGGSLFWLKLTQEAQYQTTEKLSSKTLKKIRNYLEKGQWSKATAGLKHAEGLLADNEGHADLRVAIYEFSADLNMVAELKNIALRQFERYVDDQGTNIDWAATDKRYTLAFREYFGKDLDKLTLEQAGRHLQSRSIRVHLAMALDDWALVRVQCRYKDKSKWKSLLAMARSVDRDKYRNQLREILQKRDGLAALKLAQVAPIGKLMPQSIKFHARCLSMEAETERITLLRAAHKIYPSDFWINFILANALLNRRSSREELEESIRHFTAALALFPDSSVVRNSLGVAYARNENHHAALQEFKKVTRLQPKYPQGYCNLGSTLAALKKRDDAIKAFQKAIKLKPDFALAYSSLAITFRRQGKLKEAFAAHQKALEFNPKSSAVYNDYGTTLACDRQVDKAWSALRKAVELDPDHVAARSNLAMCLSMKGKHKDALAQLQKCIELEPTNPKWYSITGNILRTHLKQPGKAIDYYRKAIVHKPNSPQLRNNLANLLVDRGLKKEAIAQYQEAIRQKPHFSAYYNLANLLEDEGKLEEAIAHFQKAITCRPTFAPAHCNLGFAYKKKGEFHKALASLRRGHELGTKQRGWRYPSARWLNEIERVVAMVDRLAKSKRHGADSQLLLRGALTGKEPLDKVRQKSHRQVHTLLLQAGKPYLIELVSPDFDTFLRVEDAQEHPLTNNDDTSAIDRNSRLLIVPQQTGKYRLIATSFDGGVTGAYFLSVQQCISMGTPNVLRGKLNRDNPRLKSGHPYQTHKFEVSDGVTYVLELDSKEFDTILIVKTAAGQSLAEDNDSGEGTNARLIFRPTSKGLHEIYVLGPRAAATGSYTLRIRRYVLDKQRRRQKAKSINDGTAR